MMLVRLLTMLASLALLSAESAPDAAPPPGASKPTEPSTPVEAAKPTAAKPRSPKTILADAIAATGGSAAWAAHKTVHVKMTIGLQGMGMGGPAEHFQTKANKSLTISTMPGIGEIREGSNGKKFWAQDPFNGLRFLKGAEAQQARVEAAWNSDMQAPKLYKAIKTVTDPPEGLECLTMTPRIGHPMRSCYDSQTHLQVSQEGINTTPQGDVPFKVTISDWRAIGGIKMPYTTEMHAGPVAIVTTVNEVTFDEPMANKIFEPPAPAKH
jgi:hypothetical protein